MSARGASNKNEAGNSEDRRRRKVWLVSNWSADVAVAKTTYEQDGEETTYCFPVALTVTVDDLITQRITANAEPFFGTLVRAEIMPACRCYRCGTVLTVETVTADRRIPGVLGGTYRQDNLRPACGPCNSITGGALARDKTLRSAKGRAAAKKRAKRDADG